MFIRAKGKVLIKEVHAASLGRDRIQWVGVVPLVCNYMHHRVIATWQSHIRDFGATSWYHVVTQSTPKKIAMCGAHVSKCERGSVVL